MAEGFSKGLLCVLTAFSRVDADVFFTAGDAASSYDTISLLTAT